MADGICLEQLELRGTDSFQAEYASLENAGETALAVRLLDAAAYRCFEGSRPLIARYAEDIPATAPSNN